MGNFIKKLSFTVLFAFALFATTTTNAFGLLAQEPGFQPDGYIENIPEDRSNIYIIGDYVFDLNAEDHGFTVNNMIRAFQTAYEDENGNFEYYYHNPRENAWQNRVTGEYLDDSYIPYMNGDGTYRYWNMEAISYDVTLESFDMTNEISLVFNHATKFDGVLLEDTEIDNDLEFLKSLLVLEEEDKQFIDTYFNEDKVHITLSDNKVEITLDEDLIDPTTFEAFGFTYDELRFDLIIDFDKFSRYDDVTLDETPEPFKLLLALEEESVVSTIKNFEQWEDSRIARVQSYLDDIYALDEVSMSDVEAIEYAREQYDALYGSAADQGRIDAETVTALEEAEADMEFLVGLNDLEEWEAYRDYLPEAQLDRIDEEDLSDYAVLRDVWAMFEELGQFDTISEFDAIFDAAMDFRMSTRDAVAYANALEIGDTLNYNPILNDVIATLDGTVLTHYHGNVSSETVDALNDLKDELLTYPESFLVEAIANETYGGYSDVLTVLYTFVYTNHVAEDGDDLQTIIDSANPYDRILVEEGTYEGTLKIVTDGITLKAIGDAENTIIDAQGATNGIEIGHHDKDGTHPTDVTIDGFTVINWEERGISQRNGDGTVYFYNNIVKGVEGSRNAIVVSGGENSEVIGNTVITASWGQPDLNGTGILLMGSINALVEDNYVDGADSGIAVGGYPIWEGLDPSWVYAEGNIIRNNTVKNSVNNGIALIGDVRVTMVENNTVIDNDNGIYLASETSEGTPSDNVITGNILEGNYKHVKDVEQTLELETVLSENTFDGDALIVRNHIVPEATGRELILGYINDVDVQTYIDNNEPVVDSEKDESAALINHVIIEFSDFLDLDEGVLDKFNEMPLNQGRHQAIGGAMFVSRDFSTIAEVKDYFEYFVDKEYAKYLYIQDVDNAQSVEAMKNALIDNVPGLNETRQELIDAGVSDLEGTNYTTTLYEINKLIEAGHFDIIEDVATYLYAERLEEGKFFGVVPIADALRAILDHHVIVVESDESIQAAIDTAEEGATIYVHEGTYEENLTLNVKNLTLLSIVEGGATVKALENVSDPAITILGENLGDVTVKGFVVEFDDVGGIVQGTSSAEGTTVHVLDNIVKAPETLVAHGNSVQVTGNDSTVIGNQITLSHQPSDTYGIGGILVVGASNVVVRDNVIIDPANLETGIWISGTLENATIENNVVTGALWGIRIDSNVTDANVVNNEVSDGGNGFIIGAADISIEQLFEDNSLKDNTVNVMDYRDGWVSYIDYTTIVVYDIDLINDALRASKENDTILVHEGTYEEDLIIETDGLTIEAVGSAQDTIIRGDLLRITGDNVTLDGFTLDGNGSRHILEINGENAVISNNIFTNATNAGIELAIAGGPAHNINIHGNTFDDTLERGVVGTENTLNITIANNTFNVTVNSIGLGEGVTLNEISGNTFNDINAMTIYEPTLDVNLIFNNTLNNGGNGYFVFDFTDEVNLQTVIDNNTFTPDAYVLYEEGYRTITVKENIDIFNETQETGHYSIQSSVDMAEEHDTIRVENGTYDGFEVTKNNLTLIGDDETNIAVNYTTTGWNPWTTAILVNGAQNLHIENFRIIGDNEEVGIAGFNGADFTVDGVHFENLVRGIYTNTNSPGSGYITTIDVVNSTFENVLVGIGGTEDTVLTATGNTFDLQREGAEGFGIGTGAEIASIYDLLKDNTFILDGTNYAVIDYRESPAMRYTGIVSEGQSIQDAIDTSATNSVILVDDGIYTEDLVFTNGNIRLEAVNAHEATIKGLITIDADAIHIEGFILENEGEGRIVMLIETDGTVLNNNIFRNSDRAIQAQLKPVTNLTVTNNVFETTEGIMSTHNIYDIVLTGNLFRTDSTGIRLSGNIDIDVVDIFDDNTFETKDGVAVVDARVSPEIVYDNDGFPQ